MQEPTQTISTLLTDTGATNHMTNFTCNLDSFIPYTGIDTVMVKNGYQLPITHIGQKAITGSNSKFLLNKVLVAPPITKNLIFIRRFA